ncbi:MAG: MerR family transcriptional regulator [Alistipes sp.]|nr:MerR family transcriptional regulator [Alistipes sp.]
MTTKKLYYSMGEVAEMFDVTPALIRHWESQFDCIKPHRNKKGNRLFTSEDVDKLKHIYHLVKERGMTLKGANQVLKRGKKDEVAQEMQLLERLQKIRATLVEVREELNGNVVEELVADVAGPIVEPVVVQPEEGVAETNVEQEKTEQLKKRVVRRKKKAEEEDKELFPFYEQSLF